LLEEAGIRMPGFVAFSLNDDLDTAEMARAAFVNFGPPYIVKPASEGASNGIKIVDGVIDLPDAIGDVLDAYGAALVEQFIRGEHVSAGVIEDFRNEELYALPPSYQKIPDGSRFIENRHHHDALLQHEVPSHFTHEEKAQIMELARRAHQALGMDHFSRADMIKTPRTTYLLEVNSVPGLYEGASFPPMLESVGSSVPEFLEHAIRLARERR